MLNRNLLAQLESSAGLWVAGVLSGTSADGIDVALARFAGSGGPECHAFRTVEFPAEWAQPLRRVLQGEAIELGPLVRLHQGLGRAFGAAARDLAQAANLPLDLVGSHGQTVWHFDGVGPPATFQVGEGNQVAAEAGVPCVHDFRTADVAAGGHGAPLAIHADLRLFGHLERPLGILNLGGMGNLSILPGAEAGAPMSFDTGPAGALLDGLARALWQAPMDRDGRWALAGTVNEAWVRGLLDHPFFAEPPPRSTGRDTFGAAFVDRFLAQVGPSARPEDLMASAVEAVARSVAQALEAFVQPRPKRLLVAGGGVHNPALMARLARTTGLEVVSSAAFGVDPDAREALLFACLAVDFVRGRTARWPEVTGAASFPIFGKACFPPAASAQG
ncbi:MAG TPA: anhydro-N-acetylmuramic acid kinase [Planctomycetota bacterium]|nr:anhydro-N-acetylmuramic acid kinase [Planctomycetota bacterium]